MVTVNIICVGSLKEQYWRDACAEYEKRLRPFCRFQVIQADEQRLPQNPSRAQIEACVSEEGKRLLAKLPRGAYSIAMCIEGRALSSPQLAQRLEQAAVGGYSSIAIFIGGSWGLSDEVKQQADFRLSMSPMTFPHQLARVMLCEQLYRAFQITTGGKYHK